MEEKNIKDDIIIIIPAYNEEENIGNIIENIVNMGYKVLVINDFSSDNTANTARKFGATVLSHSINLRYGASIQTGYKYALSRGYKYIVQLDADGQHETKHIPEMLEPLIEGKADLIIGSRFLGKCNYKIPWIKKMGIKIFAFCGSLIIRQKVTDPTSGYQAMNEKVMKYYSSDSFPQDFPDIDVIIRANKKGIKISEFPVHMTDRKYGVSMHTSIPGTLFYIFKMFLSIFIELIL